MYLHLYLHGVSCCLPCHSACLSYLYARLRIAMKLVSFTCWLTNPSIISTSYFQQRYYHIDSLGSMKAQMIVNFLQLKIDKTELFITGSFHHLSLLTDSSLKSSLGSHCKAHFVDSRVYFASSLCSSCPPLKISYK